MMPVAALALRPRRLAQTLLVLAAVLAGAAGVVAQSTFPAVERYLWKTLAPWGVQNTPGTVSVVPVLDEDGQPVYNDLGEQVFATDTDPVAADLDAEYATAFADLLVGECTFSQLGDRDVIRFPRARQCKAAANKAVPPPTGNLLNPVSLAVDGERVYISDEFNHRVQVFDFYGNAYEMASPIGNGVPGAGTYSYSGGGPSGHQLSAPYGLAVDAAHRILVADGGNSRVAIFNNDGSAAFTSAGSPVHAHIEPGASGPDTDTGQDSWPSLVVLSPGATALAPGTSPGAGAALDRIVVSDWLHCSVHIYDTGFNLITSLPTAATFAARPESDYMHDSCINPDLGIVAGPGEFSTVTGLAIDAQGRIYVADHAQSVVQVFDRDGNHLGWIGRPSETAAPAALDGPVGLAIDHLGRLGVTDAGNARVAFYTVTYPAGAPVAAFEFQLDTTVAVDDFPMGLAEQIGPATQCIAPGNCLDPKGRFLATDPLRRRVLRFELPELAIVNQQADGGTGSYDVVVPIQKASAVLGVTTTVTPVELDVTMTGGTEGPTAPVDIAPGGIESYIFTYTQGGSTATFEIGAEGDGGNAVADLVEAVAHLPCTGGCGADHLVYEHPAADPLVGASEIPTSTGQWYDREIFVRLVPTGAEEISDMFWFFEGQAAEVWGGAVTQSPLSGTPPHVDLPPIRVEGDSWVTYWPLTAAGTVGPRRRVQLKVDLRPPSIRFENWTPRTGVDGSGNDWHNVDVTADYLIEDTQSGVESAGGSVLIDGEGRALCATVNVVDRVGHGGDVSSETSTGGKCVNIDRGDPVFDSLPSNQQLIATGQDGLGGYADVPTGTLDAAASDPALADTSNGSGVMTLTNPGAYRFRMGATSWDYTATDAAGNSTSASRTFTVVKAPSVVTYTGATSVAYAETIALSASVGPAWGTGTVTFTIGSTVVTATVVNGIATATLPGATLAPGSHAIDLAYSGDGAVLGSASTAALTVAQPVAVTVRANAKSKVYGSANPVLDAVVEGLPPGGTLDYSLSTTAALTSGVGSYPITVTLGSNPAYQVSVEHSTLTVTKRDANVAIGLITNRYGDPVVLPPSLAWVTGTVFGDTLVYTLSTPATDESPVTDYPIAIDAPAASNPNYAVTVSSGTLRVTPRPATVTAVALSKTYGTPDPTLAVTHDGFLARDIPALTFSASRWAGENAGQYQTAPTASGSPLYNYQPEYQMAWFTITKASATVAANAKSRIYGDANPALDASVSGVVPGDTLNYGLSTTATTASGVGGYPITVSLGSNPNYEVAAVGSTLTVGPRAATVTAGDGSKVYGTADPVIGATGDGFLASDAGAITLTGTRVAGNGVGSYTTSVVVGGAAAANYAITPTNGTFTITPRPVTVTAANKLKGFGTADPPLTYTVTSGTLVAGDTFSGALTRDAGESIGTYVIRQGTLTLGSNYAMAFVEGVLTISANLPPNAVDDAAVIPGSGPVTVAVLANDSDPDGNPLTIASVTQPAPGTGTVAIVGATVVFTPAPGFAGTAIFTYTVSDGQGGFDTATVTLVSCDLTGFRTQSQGGWGAKPSGNNAGRFLHDNFAAVYPAGFVQIGGTFTARFTSAAAITAFLPAGGRAGALTESLTDPRRTSAGVFAGQVLALQLSVDFSNAGVTRPGLASLVVASGPLVGSTVGQVLAMANAVLGGNLGALPPGVTISTLNGVVDLINNNFIGGTQNNGYLLVAGCTANQPPAVTAEDRSDDVGESVSLQIVASDPDGGDLAFAATGLPPGLAIDADTGLITGSPATPGVYNVTVTVTDESGATASDTFCWTVEAANHAPVAADDAASTTKNTAKTIAVLANDVDPDGDALAVTAVTQPGIGVAAIVSGTKVKYTPPANWTGSVSFTYTVSDGNGGTDSATVTVSVTGSGGGGGGCGGGGYSHGGDDDDHHGDGDDDHGWGDDGDWYSGSHGHHEDGVWGHSSDYGHDSWGHSSKGFQWSYRTRW